MWWLILLACTSSDGPTVTVVDRAPELGLQDATGGQFRRGRACTVADFDGDGGLDVYVGNPGNASYILYHRPTEDGGATWVPGEPALSSDGLFWGVAAGDWDNDGDPDLAIAGGGNEGLAFDVLWETVRQPTGAPRVVDVTASAGVRSPRDDGEGTRATPTGGAVWADFDRDGHLDLYLAGNVKPWTVTEALTPDDVMGLSGLWHNQGDGTFVNRALEWGVDQQLPTRHATWLDYDNDGDVDLFENNFRFRNTLWQNQLVEAGAVSFEDVTDDVGLDGADLRYPLRSFASTTADPNNDGWLDLVVFVRGVEEEGPHRSGHTLFLNVGGRFVDATVAAGLPDGFDAGDDVRGGAGVMGCQVADIDADGIDDLYVGNGGPNTGREDNLLLSTGRVVTLETSAGTVQVPRYIDASHLVDAPAPGQGDVGVRYPPYPYRTHGICIADLDDDGLPEVLVANGGMAEDPTIVREPNRLFDFTFDPAPNSLRIHPEGDGVRVNRDGIGARVTATVRDSTEGRTWAVTGVLLGGSAFSAQNGPDVFLGLGTADEVLDVQVQWPDGHVTEVPLPGRALRHQRLVVRR